MVELKHLLLFYRREGETMPESPESVVEKLVREANEFIDWYRMPPDNLPEGLRTRGNPLEDTCWHSTVFSGFLHSWHYCVRSWILGG
jgi:hypothetical protein